MLDFELQIKLQENNSEMYLRLDKHREVRCDKDDDNQLTVLHFFFYKK
jgi:hypothetical protein